MDQNGRSAAQETLRAFQEASFWLSALPRADSAERASFAAWLTRSPLHVDEFLLARMLRDVIAGLDGERRRKIERRVGAGWQNVVVLPLQKPAANGPPYAPR